MFRYKNILVPLDGSELAERALEPAVRLARAMDAKLTLMQALEPVQIVPAETYQLLFAAQRDEAQTYLNILYERIRSRVKPLKTELVFGAPTRAILDYIHAHTIDLVVMSSHGRSGLGRWVYGSVAESVLHQAACDVSIIRAQTDVEMFSRRHILVPLDGSWLAEQAVAPAASIAGATGAELILLQVMAFLEEDRQALGIKRIAEEVAAQVQHTNEAYLERIARSVSYRVPVTRIKVVESEQPAEAIVHYATQRDVDLIAMATHGRTGVDRLLHGSVTEKVLPGAHCALLVVRPHPLVISATDSVPARGNVAPSPS